MQINLCEPYLSLPSPFGALIGIVPFLTRFPTFRLPKRMREDFNMRTLCTADDETSLSPGIIEGLPFLTLAVAFAACNETDTFIFT